MEIFPNPKKCPDWTKEQRGRWEQMQDVRSATRGKTYQEIARLPQFSAVSKRIESWFAQEWIQKESDLFGPSGIWYFENARGQVYSAMGDDSNDKVMHSLKVFLLRMDISVDHLFDYPETLNSLENDYRHLVFECDAYYGARDPCFPPKKQEIADGLFFYRLGARRDFIKNLEQWLEQDWLYFFFSRDLGKTPWLGPPECLVKI